MKKLRWNHSLKRIFVSILVALLLVAGVPSGNNVYAQIFNGGTYYMDAMNVNDVIYNGTILIGYTAGGGKYDFARIFLNGTEVKLFVGDTGYDSYTVPGNYMVSQKTVTATSTGDGSYGKGSGSGDGYYCYLYLSTYYTANFSSNGNGTVSSYGGDFVSGKSISSTATPNTGYHFTGWTGTTSNSVSTITVSGRSGNWYANFVANNYTVNYYGNGATNGVSTYSSSHTYNSYKNLAANQYERTGYTFLGWSTSSSASTASYTGGQSVVNLTPTNGGTVNLYAVWRKNVYNITCDLQGGTISKTPPAQEDIDTVFTVVAPTKKGNTFSGWTVSSGLDSAYAKWGTGDPTTAISDSSTLCANGAAGSIYMKNLSIQDGRTVTLTANWIKNKSTINIDLNGGRWTENAGAEFTDSTSITQDYESTVDIPNPVQTGSTFAGWTLTNATDGKAESGLGKYQYTFGSETEIVTLTAIWRDAAAVEVVDNSQFTVDAEQLQNLFESSNLATEPDKGITSEDISKGSVNIKVTVDDIDITSGGSGTTEGQAAVEAIQTAAGKLSPQFFDITVTKTVTPEGSTTAEESVKLTELPREAPAKVVIDVSGTELAGKSSFYVFRYHNGSVEQLSYRSVDGEFYTVNGNIITIYTRKFSTYAVTAGEVSMEGTGSMTEGSNSSAMDVQGKVTSANLAPTYKLDVTWGAMKFEYGIAGSEWNPDTHSYKTATGTAEEAGWVPSGFENGNNQIIVSNHSNADVLLSFAVNKIGTGFDDVTMSVLQENTEEADEAADITLSKVPEEEAEAPSVNVWFWMKGKPTDMSAYQIETYTKVGVITMTARTTEGSLTPRN